MEKIRQAMETLDRTMSGGDHKSPIPFEEFLKILTERPSTVVRNVIQVFHDMITAYVGPGVDEYPDDPESVNFVYYDCDKLFVTDADRPFFADRLFANRLFTHIEALRRGAIQNKLYVFEGPAGCGKSTFLNNLLMKFEQYANTEDGTRYEVIWRLNRKALGDLGDGGPGVSREKILRMLLGKLGETIPADEPPLVEAGGEYVEVPCPSHDNPLLMIPKPFRRDFFDSLLENIQFKFTLFTEKEYEWVFRDSPCTICSSLYQALLERLGSHLRVFQMLHARPYRFNRRIGEGISVFNPGDRPMQQSLFTNPVLQQRLNGLFQDSNCVRYVYSHYAKTNNGIYALMDIKTHNVERLLELHNIISEGIHKVEDIEENANSLFLALMNPEDKDNIKNLPSFSDRIDSIKVPYVLDLKTEVEIYRHIFGRHVTEGFLPRVLHNFARVIISTRLKGRSEALLEWISDPSAYRMYCDDNLLLLKMEIYTGHIPPWLSEDDRRGFTAKRRRRILAESESEGEAGLSGRDSIEIFNEFWKTYAKEDTLINMSMLYSYFTNVRRDFMRLIPSGFMDSLLRMYDYTVLQEVKEALYEYNEQQVSRDIQNYVFAVNFEPGTVETCRFTGDRLAITMDLFEDFEKRILGASASERTRLALRRDTQHEYTTRTLTQEMMLEKKPLTATLLYASLHERYLRSLKEHALDPFLENENFRAAIKDYGTDGFKTYDRRIQEDVVFLMSNLESKQFSYTPKGAKEVCIYVVDNDLARTFAHR